MSQKTKTSKTHPVEIGKKKMLSSLNKAQTTKNFTEEFYHIKPINKVDKILKEGLKAHDGKIFVITSKDIKIAGQNIVERIARTQMFLEEYVLFKISGSGITGKITSDDVGEFTAQYHRVIHQDVIQPEYLELVEKVKLKPIADLMREQLKKFNLSDEQMESLITSELFFIEHAAKIKTGQIKK